MKRIYNNIPLQSVLYLINGTKNIRIIDRKDRMYEETGKVIYEGSYNNMKKVDFYNQGLTEHKVEYATVHGIEAEGDTLVFIISTRFEEY